MPVVFYVDTGTDIIADLITSQGSTATWFIAWGTGGSSTGATATNGDVDLAARATESAVSATTEDQPASDTNRWVGRLQTTTAKIIEEVGLFVASAGTATDMVIRNSHGGITLATDDIIEYDIRLQQTNG